MRVRSSIVMAIADDTAMKNILFENDDTWPQMQSDNYQTMVSGKLFVTPGATVTVPVGEITNIRGAYIQTNAECNLKINGGSNIQLRAANSDDPTCRFFIEATLTSLQVVADSAPASTLTGVYVLWGDLLS